MVSGLIAWRTKRSVEQLKANLERGLYVSKAQYDLELESFKTLWRSLSDLRLKVRGFLAPDRIQLSTPEGEDLSWKFRALEGAIKDFFAAHDCAVQIVLHQSPFYPEIIRKAAEKTFEIDLLIIRRLSKVDHTLMSESWLSELRTLSANIDKQVYEVETLIRSRLESLRII